MTTAEKLEKEATEKDELLTALVDDYRAIVLLALDTEASAQWFVGEVRNCVMERDHVAYLYELWDKHQEHKTATEEFLAEASAQ